MSQILAVFYSFISIDLFSCSLKIANDLVILLMGLVKQRHLGCKLQVELSSRFTTLVMIRMLLSAVMAEDGDVWMRIGVSVRSWEDQRCRGGGRGEGGAVGGVTTMAWGLSLFVHKNGVCAGPGPPSLILYQLTPPPPRPHAQTQPKEETDAHAWYFPAILSALCSLCCPQIYCIPSAGHFLNYRLEVPLVTKKKKMTQMFARVLCVFESGFCCARARARPSAAAVSWTCLPVS